MCLLRAVRQGTLTHASPEVIMGRRTGPPADIYSLGLVMKEVITGLHITRRGGGRRIRVPDDCPQAISDLVEDCLVGDPARRPTARQVLERLLLAEARGSPVTDAGAAPQRGRPR